MNNKEQIDISGNLVVKDDVSFNAHLSVLDASFQNNVDIAGKLVVKDDVSFNAHLSVLDASFQNNVDISGKLMVDGDVSFNAHLSVLDASFQNNVDIAGKLVVDGNGTIDAYDKNPINTVHGIVGREPLYTWFGDVPFYNTLNVRNEPFNYNSDSSWRRITVVGGVSLHLSYSTSAWNHQYMFRAANMSIDNDGNTASPAKYIKYSLPVRWVNGKTCSHTFYHQNIFRDRFENACVFITDGTNWYRVGATTTTAKNTSATEHRFFQSLFPGPNGDVDIHSVYHQWVNCSIPKYIVEQYSYTTTEDNKSKYNRNIDIVVCAGTTTHDAAQLWISGIAMRPNIYGFTIHPVRAAYEKLNGGNAITRYSDYWEGTALGQLTAQVNYTNILIPICPPNDPSIYGYPDFYLGFFGHKIVGLRDKMAKFYLHGIEGSTHTYVFLGRPSWCYKGRYGLFYGTQLSDNWPERSDYDETALAATGVYVPSPEPKHIAIVHGRPYLRIRIDNTIPGTINHHPKGFYTEVVYPDGSSDGYGAIT